MSVQGNQRRRNVVKRRRSLVILKGGQPYAAWQSLGRGRKACVPLAGEAYRGLRRGLGPVGRLPGAEPPGKRQCAALAGRVGGPGRGDGRRPRGDRVAIRSACAMEGLPGRGDREWLLSRS